LPCSNVVARYHQRWLRLMLWVSVVLLPVPLFLTVRDWAFYTRGYLWAAYQTLMLLLFLGYVSRKQMILKVIGRSENVRHPLFWATINALYPLFYVCTAGLLVLQILGYSALTHYLISATTATMGTLVLSAFIVKYVNDLAQKLRRRLRAAAEKAEAAERRAEDGRSAALSAGREVVLVDAKTPVEGELPLNLLTGLFRLVIWGVVLVLSFRYWGVSWVQWQEWMAVEVAAGGADGRPAVTVARALMAALVVVAAWILSRSLRTILETQVYPSYAQLDRGGRVAVNTVLHYFLLLLGLYFAMYLMRIPLGAVTVVLGTVGLGLGLASQPMFMNFLSGLIMLFERHVKVGDIIEVDGALGEVTNISIRATTIKTYDNVDMVIPNSDFVGGKVTNWTLNDARIRGKLTVGVAYGTDPRTVERLLLQVASESPLVLRDPPPRVRFTDFGDNSLNFGLYAWFANVTDRWDFLTDARFRIVELFEKHGIEIPFPQRTLNLREDQPLRVQVLSERTDSPC
jgi:small-conductance mechanosensitive channel